MVHSHAIQQLEGYLQPYDLGAKDIDKYTEKDQDGTNRKFSEQKEVGWPQPPVLEDTKELLKARYVFGFLSLLGVAILYALRVNLSVAIVTMVNNTALTVPKSSPGKNASNEDVCPGHVQEPHTMYTGEFLWDEERQGLMLAGFFYGYAIGQLPGGLMAEKLGGKLIFGLGTFLTAVLTVVSPLCLWTHENLFFAVRFLEGLTEGVTFPAMQSMISKWSPPNERSRFSIIFSGSYLGTVLCMPISGLLCDLTFGGGWPLVFYVFGALGMLWYIPWLLLVFDSPEHHPRISEKERKYIQASIGTVPQKKPPIPWKQLLATPGLWACAAMHLGIGWNFFGQITYLPTYMSNILHYKIENNAALSAVPYVLGGVSSVVSSLALDFVITRRYVTPISGFRIFNGITGLGAAVTLLLIPFAGCDRVWINVLLAANGLALGAQYAGNGMNLLVLAPNFAGTTYGISNTLANAAGILAPYTVGFLTYGSETRHSWNTMFYISAAIGFASYAAYLLLCTDKEQPWNNPQEDEDTKAEGDGGHVNDAFEREEANSSTLPL